MFENISFDIWLDLRVEFYQGRVILFRELFGNDVLRNIPTSSFIHYFDLI